MRKLAILFIIALFCSVSCPLKAQKMNFVGISMVCADSVKANLSELGFTPIKKSKGNGFIGSLLEKEVVARVTETSAQFRDGDKKTLNFYLQFYNLSTAEVEGMFAKFANQITDEYNVEPMMMDATPMLFLDITNSRLSQTRKCKSVLVWEVSRFKNITMYYAEDKLCIFFLDMDVQ